MQETSPRYLVRQLQIAKYYGETDQHAKAEYIYQFVLCHVLGLQKVYDTFDKNMQDEFDHIRLILRKDYSKLQKGTTLSTESEGDEKSVGTHTAESGS